MSKHEDKKHHHHDPATALSSKDYTHELEALDQVLHREGAPMRVVNVFDGRGFSNRATVTSASSPSIARKPCATSVVRVVIVITAASAAIG